MTTILFGAVMLAILLLSIPEKSGEVSQTRPEQSGGNTPDVSGQEHVEDAGSSRYGVFDQSGNHVTNWFEFDEAKKEWKNKTSSLGSIMDLETGEICTPKRSLWQRFLDWLCRRSTYQVVPSLGPAIPKPARPLSPEELQQIKNLLKHGYDRKSKGLITPADPHNVGRILEWLNGLNLPVYEAAKKVSDQETKLVPIKKRRKKINRKKVRVPIEKTRVETKIERVPSPVPTDHMEIRRIRSLSELKRLSNKLPLALPSALLAKKLVGRELPVIDYEDEVRSDKIVTEASTQEVMVDEPVIEEYVDYVEVAKEPTGQLAMFVRDVSGSMAGISADIAVAVEAAVVGRNLHNRSRYIDSVFGDDGIIRTWRSDETEANKIKLIQNAMAHACYEEGTDILLALKGAAAEIRKCSNPDDKPEIILITDGSDSVTAEEIYEVIGEDIILHTVMINGTNISLESHSTTYSQINGHQTSELRFSLASGLVGLYRR